MSPEYPRTTESEFEARVRQAEAEFGADAEFTYLSPRDNLLYTMNLRAAVKACGPYMKEEDDSSFKAKLSEYRALAMAAKEMDPVRYEQSIARGEAYFNR